MELFLLFVVGVITMAAWGRHWMVNWRSRRRLSKITVEMIEPRGKPLTRQEAVDAYVQFYIDHFDPSCGHELQSAADGLLAFISERIEEVEQEREETFKALRRAKQALRSTQNDGEPEGNDDFYLPFEGDADTIRETITRRQARLDAQDHRIADLKADVRPLLVEFINKQLEASNSS
jgi:hypothetical protein